MTIGDVAARAGVGAGTVSRVLNDSPNVRAGTRARVLAAIEVLDYRPNPLARGLKRGRSQTIGVIVPCFTHASAIERLRGVVDVLKSSRYDLVLFDVESVEHRDEHLSALSRQRTDGLLVLSLPLPPDRLQVLGATGIPTVLIDAQAPGMPSVVTDDVEGGRLAVRHLVGLGHRRIAFLGDAPDNPFGFPSSASREAGYLDALTEAGLDAPPAYRRYGAHERIVGERWANELLALDDPPTAIFTCSDVQAIGVIDAARAAGVRVPDELSVVGFDDVELASYVGLTTVRQPLYRSGQLGAQLLLEALGDGGDRGADVHQLPLELVERDTTAPPPKRSRASRTSRPRSKAAALRGTRSA